MNPFTFLQEVRAQMEKVVWPTRQQAMQLTVLVIAISLIVGIYVGGLDFGLTNLMNIIISK